MQHSVTALSSYRGRREWRAGLSGLAIVIIAFFLLIPDRLGRAAGPTPWAAQHLPAPGLARIWGGTTSGCLQGAEELPDAPAAHYRLIHPERHRNFGHPRLVRFIVNLSEQMAQAALPPLGVGDLSQPRGGPAPTGHSSHQTGLDVDLWYTAANPGAEAPSLVNAANNQPLPALNDSVERLLRLAASATDVERIFVNPAIKQHFCRQTSGDRAWLHRLRPWYGHADHFHVRLSCPLDSPQCVPQAPLPAGDGCAELPAWLDPKQKQQQAAGAQAYKRRLGKAPSMPEACLELVKH